MVLALANQYLLSGGTFAEAGYVFVCDGAEVKIYDGHTTKITVSYKAVLKVWRCPRKRLWRIPLQVQVIDLSMHTLILNGPTGHEFFNSLYAVPSSALVLDHIELFNNNPARPAAEEAVHNVYNIPSIERDFGYLHAAAGFPTKAMRIKSIRNRNYLTWPLIIVIKINKHFP